MTGSVSIKDLIKRIRERNLRESRKCIARTLLAKQADTYANCDLDILVYAIINDLKTAGYTIRRFKVRD